MKAFIIISIVVVLGFFLACIYSLCKIASVTDDELEKMWGYKDNEEDLDDK